jgi:hypothetical protein
MDDNVGIAPNGRGEVRIPDNKGRREEGGGAKIGVEFDRLERRRKM